MQFITATKPCSSCSSWRGPQPLESFDVDRRNKTDGRRSVCKLCRKQERIEKVQAPNNGRAPNAKPAKLTPSSEPNSFAIHRTKAVVFKIFASFWLGVLFIGGFAWSSLNGAFAFLNTAKIFSATAAPIIAFVAASVLTLGSAVSASCSVRQIQLCRARAASIMIIIFAVIQSFNIIVNLTGVKKRLLLTQANETTAKVQKEIMILEELARSYQTLIDRYPLFDGSGRALKWKREHTMTVKAAQDSLMNVNQKIAAQKMNNINPGPKFDLYIITAWLALPELCMLVSILAFALALRTDNTNHNHFRMVN